MKQDKGFTLIELLIVIGIIGILSMSGLSAFKNTQRNGRDARRKTDLEQVRSALELYHSDNKQYPNGTGNISTSIRTALISPVVYVTPNNFPQDPSTALGFYYYYQRNPGGAGNNTYRLCAYLEDLKPSDTACPNTAVACGGGKNCNYGVTQP
jgi:general secretion pathway protein G